MREFSINLGAVGPNAARFNRFCGPFLAHPLGRAKRWNKLGIRRSHKPLLPSLAHPSFCTSAQLTISPPRRLRMHKGNLFSTTCRREPILCRPVTQDSMPDGLELAQMKIRAMLSNCRQAKIGKISRCRYRSSASSLEPSQATAESFWRGPSSMPGQKDLVQGHLVSAHVAIQHTTADESGHYRLFGIRAGPYLVSAFANENVVASTCDPQAQNVARMKYQPRYYPGVPSRKEAVPIHLSMGETRENIDFQLSAV
jgi:hypothetical protein